MITMCIKWHREKENCRYENDSLISGLALKAAVQLKKCRKWDEKNNKKNEKNNSKRILQKNEWENSLNNKKFVCTQLHRRRHKTDWKDKNSTTERKNYSTGYKFFFIWFGMVCMLPVSLYHSIRSHQMFLYL